MYKNTRRQAARAAEARSDEEAAIASEVAAALVQKEQRVQALSNSGRIFELDAQQRRLEATSKSAVDDQQ